MMMMKAVINLDVDYSNVVESGVGVGFSIEANSIFGIGFSSFSSSAPDLTLTCALLIYIYRVFRRECARLRENVP